MPSADPLRDLVKRIGTLQECAKSGMPIGADAQGDISKLRERIISEPAATVDGVLAKISYLESVTWCDNTRRLAQGIRSDIENLWPL